MVIYTWEMFIKRYDIIYGSLLLRNFYLLSYNTYVTMKAFYIMSTQPFCDKKKIDISFEKIISLIQIWLVNIYEWNIIWSQMFFN